MTSLTGEGAVVATLSGDTLKITGAFEGLSAPATDAHVMMGEGTGIPGGPILDLATAQTESGSISGTFKLNGAQLAALQNGRLYIQVNSQAGRAPGGNLWGWLLPEHVEGGPGRAADGQLVPAARRRLKGFAWPPQFLTCAKRIQR